jgi:hypothetical protein
MRWLAIGFTAAAAVLAGCDSGGTDAATGTLTLNIEIGDDTSTYERGCTQGDGRYAEISSSMPIVVAKDDWNAPVVGTGRMVSGERIDAGNCLFTGYVEDLPREEGTIYRIELGDSGFELTYSYEQLEAKDWTVDVALLANIGDWTVESDSGAPTAKMGEPASTGDYEFVVKSVKCGEPTAGADMWFVAAKGQLCRLELSITNKGDQTLDMPMTHQLIDRAGREVNSDFDAMFAEINTAMQAGGENVWFAPLDPGDEITADVLFDVPWDFEPVKVELNQAGPFLNPSVVVALT